MIDFLNAGSQQVQVEGEEASVEQLIIKKKREKFMTEIRNSKKKMILNSNRVRMFQKYIKEMTNTEESLKSIVPEYIYTNPAIYVDQLIAGLRKDYQNYQASECDMLIKSLHHLRLLSSLKNSQSILIQIIDSDIHPLFIHLMGTDFNRQIRLESATILCNCLTVNSDKLFTITHDQYKPILSGFTSLYLMYHDEELFEIGVWGLANLCIDNKEAAKIFFDEQGLKQLEDQLIIYEKNPSIQETLAWMMTTFSHYQKLIGFEDRLLFLRLAEKFVMHQSNPQIQNYGVRTIYHLTKEEDMCQALSKRITLLDRLFFLVNNGELINYVIGIMGNLLACPSNIAKVLLEKNILEYLSIALDNVRQDVRNEALWCISNLLSGDEEEIQHVLDFNRLLDKIFQIARVDSIQNILEVCMGLSNCLGKANNIQVMKLIQHGILETFMHFLLIQDINIITKTLQGVGFLLDYGDKIRQSNSENPVKNNLQSLGFNDILLSLQYHPHDTIYELSNEILTEYYSNDLKVTKNILNQHTTDTEI